MSKRVVENLTWRNGSWNESSVHDLHADYTYVPDSSELSEKANVSFVNQKISDINNNLESRLSALEKQIEESIQAIQESVEESLCSEERIENEKKELSSFFDILTSKIKGECQEFESQIRKEVEAYQYVDKSLNDRLFKLISQKNDFVNAKNNASTILQELKRQITLADETVKNIKGNPNVIVHNFTQKVESMSYITYFLLANVILADIYLLYLLFSH